MKLNPSTKATEAILAGKRMEKENWKDGELKRRKISNINRVKQKQSILRMSGC